ncbi:MAG: phosphotransferase [Deltaproteobacteria bacterium]|nr:phosphotransferase [Deltaproteobacteria bacterium]
MLEWIAAVTGARRARRGAQLQSLWGGYGELFRVELDGGVAPTAVVKWVRPPAAAQATISDARKRRSYDVEATFYRDFAARCDDSCRVARLYGSRSVGGEWLFVLEDLDAAGFAIRHDDADATGLDACLSWLASFHARFLDAPANELWPTGTYWHLATRTDELSAISDPALRTLAPWLDARLTEARYQTILHGDPKEANFCFSEHGRRVAAVDFQYTGRGCAMKDVAYLLYGRSDEPADGIAHDHLDTYFRELRGAVERGPIAERVDLAAVEQEGRALYPLARLDFCRFLAGWRPARWQRDQRGQAYVRRQLERLGQNSK